MKMWAKFIGALVVLFALDAVLIFAPTFAPVLGKRAESAAQSSCKTQQNSYSEQNPSPAQQETTVTIRSPLQVSIAKSYSTFVQYIYDWGPWAFALLLVVVGFFQVRLLKQTRDEIKRQADTLDTQAADSTETRKLTGTLASQALRQSDLTQRQLELTHRPWIALESVAPASDLVFNEGGATLILNLQVRNVGNSIAKHVRPWVDYAISGVTQMSEVTERVIEILKTPQPPGMDLGTLLFPNQPYTSQYPITIQSRYIAQALESGDFKDQGGISFEIVVCFDYESTIDPGRHYQTRSTFGVARIQPQGGPINGIFQPAVKAFPAQLIAIFYRGYGAHAD